MSEWDYDDRPELPPESGDLSAQQFDPDNTWLETAPRELQIEAMRCWFYARYQDPAHDTPYDGREGGYLFVHGGPYDPNDVIQERFDKTVEFEVMEELIAELHGAEGGDEWAPIYPEDEGWNYEDLYSLRPEEREDPLRMLNERLEQIEETIEAQSILPSFVTHLLHSAAITALEAYLWDTTSYWVTRDKKVLRSFVKSNKDFTGQKFQLSDVFTVMDDLERKVADYLQTFIWHRLDKVKPLLEMTLGINFPEIEKFIPEIIIRHDIVHRGGRDKDGYPVLITIGDVRRLARLVEEFSQELEGQLKKVFPIIPIVDEF